MPTKGSDNIFPKLILSAVATPATPDADTAKLYVKSDGLLYWIDDAGTEYAVSYGSGLSAHLADTSDAHDASAISIADAGTYFTGTDVEAALQELGAGGGGGGGISSGTSNPGSPSAGDLFWRTDLGLLIYYDGTRWLTTTLFATGAGIPDTTVLPFTTTGSHIYLPMVNGAYDVWLVYWYVTTNVLTTNDGTKYWTVVLEGKDGVDIATFTTAGDTAGTAADHKAAIGALLGSTFANDTWIQMTANKTSTPGNIYVVGQVTYRLVIT